MSVTSRIIIGLLPTGVLLANVTARQSDVGNVLISEQSTSFTAVTATSIASSTAYLGTPTFSAYTAIWVNTWVLDNGLLGLQADADNVYICSQQPTTFTEATSTYGLGNYNFGAGNVFGTSSSYAGGMQISSNPITTGSITGNGTVAAWAVVDSVNSRLLATGLLTGGTAVTSGQVFGLGSFTIQMPHN